MRAGLQHSARTWLLIALVVIGMSLFDLGAGQRIVGVDLLTAADACCEPEVDAGHASECLPICGTGGQAVLPGFITLPLPFAPQFRPEPDIGGDTRFADLDPHPPRRLSDTI